MNVWKLIFHRHEFVYVGKTEVVPFVTNNVIGPNPCYEVLATGYFTVYECACGKQKQDRVWVSDKRRAALAADKEG